MAGKARYLQERDGRYYARLVIPKALRALLDGKVELRSALGADRKTALSRLPGAVADLQHQIGLAERRAGLTSPQNGDTPRYPLRDDQIALSHYTRRLELDERFRNTDPGYAKVMIDDALVASLQEGIAGRLTNADLEKVIGPFVHHYNTLGNHSALYGSDDWRSLARAICVAEYEALSRVFERDEGNFSGAPTNPLLVNAVPPAEEPPASPLSIKDLFSSYVASRVEIGKGKEVGRRWPPVFESLQTFTGSDDARRLTKRNLLDWRDALLKSLAPKTVSDVYLTAVRSVLNWAVANDLLESNVAEKVRQEVPRRQLEREKGYTLEEAIRILKASRDYTPTATENQATTELVQTTSAKQWTPILCALTGARVTEITQLRKQDFRQDGDMFVLRINPGAGTVKAGDYRDVPVHHQLIDLGLMEFVERSAPGPLFYRDTSGERTPVDAARVVSGRISVWMQSLKLVPENVAPSHAWRHRFKTVARDQEISDRVIDAIQGHASKTAGDNYGDVTLKARKAAIARLPAYAL